MAARLRIVVGFRPDGRPESLYVGESGAEADEAFHAASAPEFSRVEYFPFPMPAKRRRLAPTVTESVTAKPQPKVKAKAKAGKKQPKQPEQ